MDPIFRTFIYDTRDNIYVMSDVVSGNVIVIKMITKDSFAVVATTKTANPSIFYNQSVPFTQ